MVFPFIVRVTMPESDSVSLTLSISAYTLLYSYCSFHLFLQYGAKEDKGAFTPPSRPLRPSHWKLHDPRGYSLRGAVIENLNAEIATLKGHVT